MSSRLAAPCVTFAPGTVDRFVALMKSGNPKIERSALLVNTESAALGLQISRMLKEAAHPARRAFADPSELTTWLSPVLTVNEQSALAAFLAE
jgi:hypothetical protein